MVIWQAYAISAIARWDWPDEWPDLFNQLVQAVASGNPYLVHGAMRVLTGQLLIPSLLCYYYCIEFCQEVTDQQMPHVAPVIFPQLLQVITQPQVSCDVVLTITNLRLVDKPYHSLLNAYPTHNYIIVV